jgi:Fe-S cluster assembly iron-binding protein IscA
MAVQMSLLSECRRNIERYRRSLWARPGLWRVWPRTTAIQSPQVARAYRDLIGRGQAVWGAVVQANFALTAPGPYDLPGNIVFSPSPHFDERPLELLDIAVQVGGLKGRAAEFAANPEMQAIAATISDEKNLAVNRLLPPLLTGGHEVYLTWMTFHRDSLPGGVLHRNLLPLFICPPATEIVIVLPLAFWSAGLQASWGRQPEWRIGNSAVPEATPDYIASAPAFPRQPSAAVIVAAQPAATDFPVDGVALTPAAAKVFQSVLAQQAAQHGRAFLHVDLRDGREILEVADAFDHERHLLFRSQGIDILIDRNQLPLLAGTLIDFASSPYEAGFKFLRQGESG